MDVFYLPVVRACSFPTIPRGDSRRPRPYGIDYATHTVPGGMRIGNPNGRIGSRRCGLTKKSTAVPGTSGPAGADKVKFWYLIIFASGVDDMTSPLNVFRKPSNLAPMWKRGTKNVFASSLLEHASRSDNDHLLDQLVSLLRIVGNQYNGKIKLTQDP